MKNNKLLIFILVIATLLIAALFLPVTEWMQTLVVWIQDNPGISWLIFILLYVAATVLLFPAIVLTLAAGAIFGVVKGTILVSVASIMGAALAFVVGRTVAREQAQKFVNRMPKFMALDKAIETRGFLVVVLTRLSPIFPFILQNYAYSLTSINFRQYFFASWIGMFPGTLLYVYFGSVATSLAAIFNGDIEGGNAGKVLFFVGLLATIVVTVLVTRVASKALKEQLAESEQEGLSDA